MRALLFVLPALLVGCGSNLTNQREILKRSQVEIDRREPWSRTAAIFVTNPGDYDRFTWKVKAGALDYSAYHPIYRGTYFIPGTERELRFTRDGCLMSYDQVGSRCPVEGVTDSSQVLMAPEK